jgi:predicted heme/steroid binding protein/uncharacterized membrane protein
MDKTIREEDLHQNDGQEGRPAYVVYQGTVYDVSGSKMWRDGSHVRRHRAGQDLTADLGAAPHDESVFERVTPVGQLAALAAPDEPVQEIPALLSWFLARHPHPISVHFPIAYIVAAAALLILNLLTNSPSFETAGYYLLWGSVIMAPVAMALGAVSWNYNYGRMLKGAFTGKIILSILFLIVGVIALTLRVSDPGIFLARDPAGWVYFGLVIVMVLLASVVGWLGDVVMYGK